MNKSIKEKIKDMKKVSSDMDYLTEEFRGKLYSTIDGYVSIEQMLDFAMEYDYLLEHILATAKTIKETIK